MTDGSGAIQSRYDYDPYGRQTKLSGSLDADFGFTGHFEHPPTGLALTLYRAYDPSVGRWLSEDPLGYGAGPNNYAYVDGNPVRTVDLLGLYRIGLPLGGFYKLPQKPCPDASLWQQFVYRFRITMIEASIVPGPQALYIPEGMAGAKGAEILSRLGTSKESVARLARKAAEAEEGIGIHGVSVTAGPPSGAASQATREAVEAAFPVHNTGQDLHRTVELPKPVTQAVADLFNSIFGR
jgi:RHS repeat-associated protein